MSSIDMSSWHGRIDSDEVDALRWHQVIKPWRDEVVRGTTLIGFCCDAGVARNHGRVGAAGGPQSVRAALANLAWHGSEALFDAGDVRCIDDALENAQTELATKVATALARQQRPIVVGGGHEVAWGSWQGLAQFAEYQSSVPRIAIVNFDAHFDLRLANRGNSGTPFKQIADDCANRGWPFKYLCLGIATIANTRALFTRAQSLNARWVLDTAMRMDQLPKLIADINALVNTVDIIYMTIDLDVLPAYVAPGVSAPAAYGVELAVIESLVDALLSTNKVRLVDVAELNPRFDIDQRTAKVAARLISRCIR